MRFVLYTDKTVPQCLTAINERMHAKATSTRPALDGWVEKGGAFALTMSAPVIGKFARRTTLKGEIEREDGLTVIRGNVPGGVPRRGQGLIFVALAIVAVTIMGSGNLLVGLLLIPVGLSLYIPMHGDYLNSEVLVDEVEKTLKAKPTPPKASAEPKTRISASSPKLPKAKPAPTKRPATRAASSATPRPKPAKPSAGTTPTETVTTVPPNVTTPATVPKPQPPPESEFPPMTED